MNPMLRCTIARCLPLVCLVALTSIARADQWTAPTAEELKMTSQPQVPGAGAVYLFKEEVTEDKLHMWSKYVRLKVLTEAGKEYANVELKHYSSSEHGGYSVDGIAGRTIHPDGTIIPFTGKPFDKLIEKGQPPPTGRHRYALVKFFARSVVIDIDRKLRAWATLAGERRLRQEHVLENVGGFDVVFKVADQCIQVVQLRQSQ